MSQLEKNDFTNKIVFSNEPVKKNDFTNKSFFLTMPHVYQNNSQYNRTL